MMHKVLEVARCEFYEYRYGLAESDVREAFFESCNSSGWSWRHQRNHGTRRIGQSSFQAASNISFTTKCGLTRETLGPVAKSRSIRTKATISSSKNHLYAPGLLHRNFSAVSPGEVFLGDTTYIRTTADFILRRQG